MRERGLKWFAAAKRKLRAVSLPMRGAWIEMKEVIRFLTRNGSLPMRGAWIEIMFPRENRLRLKVAPHAGNVD